jgi:putative ABC transport system permease protein
VITLTLALRYLRGRALRTVLTTLAIVFGVLVVFGMNTLMPAFMRAYQANVMAASGQVDAVISLRTADAFDAAVAGRVAAVDGVSAVSGLLDRTVNVPADYFDGDPATADRISALNVLGIDVEAARALHVFTVTSGRFLESADRAAVTLSENAAQILGLGVGDTLKLPTTQGEASLTVVGILPDRGVPGNEVLLVTLAQAQAMFDAEGKINTVEANFDTADAARRTEIERAIIATLGEGYHLGALSSNSELLTGLALGQAIFTMLGLLALLMGAFIIFNTFRTIVAERRRDIGMLRSLGASRRAIIGIVLSEGLIQGVIGSALGLVLGYLLGLGMVAFMSPIAEQYLNIRVGNPEVSPLLLIGSLSLGVGVTLLAGLIPAISASRITPLEALRPAVGEVAFRRMAGAGFWTGALLLGLSVAALFTQNTTLVILGSLLFVVGLILAAPALISPIANLLSAAAAGVFARGGTAQLAQGNLARQPTRAAITASTTLIALAILVMAASTISSLSLGFERVLRRSLGSDFVFVPPSVAVWGTNVGAGRGLAEDLRDVEGVEVVTGLRYAPSEAGGTAIAVLGIDPVTYPQVSGLTFVSGEEATAYGALSAGREVIINGILRTTIQADLGDEITLLTPTGPQTYHIAGVAGDYLNAKIPTAYISQANIGADFDQNEDVLLQANLAAGADAQAVETAFRAILADYPQFRLIEGQTYIEESLAVFNAAFAGMIALAILLSVPSLIAMINTLAIGVIERTREIGMLRAVGATRPQVRTVIVAEAVILAAIGTAFGLLSGLYLGYMMVKALAAVAYPIDYIFPAAGVLIAVASGLLFGALAAIIPARQAARLEVVRALRYE